MILRPWPFSVLVIAAFTAQGAAAQAKVDTLSLKATTYFLAHDLLQGRATGTQGAEIAATYIVGECRRYGLAARGSDYVQTVPLEEATVEPGTYLLVERENQLDRFTYPEYFTPDVGTRSTLVDFTGPAVFVGPATELDTGPIGDLDLHGAVAVTVGARVSTAAAKMLQDSGAVGLVQLLGDQGSYDLYNRSRGETRLYHADWTVRSSFLPTIPSVLAGPRLSRAILAGTGIEQGRPPQLGPVGRTVTFNIEVSTRAFGAANVACLLPGSNPLANDTLITFTAHYDHLGIGVPDSTGDAIYNGFSDNAAGVAMLLAIAQAMTQDPSARLRHAVLFLFLAGEERGLLGSDYYVSSPVWPLSRTRAVINIDAGAPPAPPASWRLAGVDSSGLGGLALAATAERGWTATTSPPRANSDYYPFVREGVPAVFIIPGNKPYEGLTADSSAALRKRWDHYHQPADEWAEDFPFAGMARYAEYAYMIARVVDSSSAPIPRPTPR